MKVCVGASECDSVWIQMTHEETKSEYRLGHILHLIHEALIIILLSTKQADIIIMILLYYGSLLRITPISNSHRDQKLHIYRTKYFNAACGRCELIEIITLRNAVCYKIRALAQYQMNSRVRSLFILFWSLFILEQLGRKKLYAAFLSVNSTSPNGHT